MKLIISILTVLSALILNPLFGSVFDVSGNAKIAHKIYLSYNIGFKEEKKEVIRIPLFEDDSENCFLYQSVKSHNVIFNSKPLYRRMVRDSYGNQFIEAAYEPRKIRSHLNTISYEIRMKVFVDTILFALHSSRPVFAETLFQDGLTESEEMFSGFFDTDFKDTWLGQGYAIDPQSPVLKSIIKKLRRKDDYDHDYNVTFDAAQKLLTYIKQNIKMIRITEEETYLAALSNKSRPIHDSRFVYTNHEGSFIGINNFMISVLRGLGIPVRWVKGYRLPGESILDGGDYRIVINHHEARYYWIEIFLPGMGWLGMDPCSGEFIMFPYYIKENHGPDFPSLFHIDLTERLFNSDISVASESLIDPDFHITFRTNRFDWIMLVPPVMPFTPVNAFPVDRKPGIAAVSESDFIGRETGSFEIDNMLMQKVPVKKSGNQYAVLRLKNLLPGSGTVEIKVYESSNVLSEDPAASSYRMRVSDLGYLGSFHNFVFKLNWHKVFDPEKEYWLRPVVKGKTKILWGLTASAFEGIDFDSLNLEGDKRTWVRGDFLGMIR